MNAGLVIGRVRDRNGNAISGATVWMFDLFGKAGGPIHATGDKDLRPGSPYTETDSKGYYELAFAWRGGNIGHVVGGSGRVNMKIAANDTVWNSNTTNTNYTVGPIPIVGHVIKDLLGMAGLTPPDLKNLEGILEFSKETLESLSSLKSHPVFKTNLLSTESWLILATAHLVIKK